jgi:hypothetical protein
MSYFRPYIDAAGLHIPTYNGIKEFLLNEARGIYGADIYLENDSQDYEFITLMADRIHDAFLVMQMIYNNRSPQTAVGAALDGLVRHKAQIRHAFILRGHNHGGTQDADNKRHDRGRSGNKLDTAHTPASAGR